MNCCQFLQKLLLQKCLKQLWRNSYVSTIYVILFFLGGKKKHFFFLFYLIFFFWFSSKNIWWNSFPFSSQLTLADMWRAEAFQPYPLQDHTTTAVLCVLPQITCTPAWQAVLSLERVTCTWVYLKERSDWSGLSAMTIEIKDLKLEPLQL